MYDLDHLRKFSSRPFIIYREKESMDQQIYSYNDIAQRIESILQKFNDLNITQKCGIAIKFKHQHATVLGYIAILSILNHECYFCPISHEDDITSLGLEVSYLITDDRSDQRLLRATFLASFLNDYNEEELVLLKLNETKISTKNWCYCITTSGSTGQPKLVYVPYACIAKNVISLSSILQVTKDDVIFLGSPITFDPFVIELLMAIHNGAALLLTTHATRQLPSQLVSILFSSALGATIYQTTPSLFRLFGVKDIRERIFSATSSLRVLLLGGEAFPKVGELKSWLPDENLQKRIYNVYGITEMSCWGLIQEVRFDSNTSQEDIPLGNTIERDTELRILCANGDFLSGPGEGELFLGSSSRKCFIPLIDKNDTANDAIIYRSTGDLVKRTANGNVYYIGRLNDTIKRFGKRFSLDELSAKIESLIMATIDAKVIVLWSESKKKLICCFRYNGEMSKDSLSKKIAETDLRSHEKPDLITFIDEFPLNKHGKIDRHKLLQTIESSHLTIQDPVDTFHNFLKDVLGIEIGAEYPKKYENVEPLPHKRSKNAWHSSFHEVGGSSFQALSLSLEIGEHLRRPEDQREFLEHLLNPNVTLEGISSFLEMVALKKSPMLQTIPKGQFANKFRMRWGRNFGKCVDASPIIVHGKYVCVGSHSHSLRTLDLNGGDIMHLQLPDRIECTVEHVPEREDLAFVGCYDGLLYAFDVVTGKMKWSVNVGGMIKAKPLWISELQSVVVGCYAEEFNLWCLGLEDNHIHWRVKLGTKGILSSPVYSALLKSIFVCCLDGTYASFNSIGHVNWSQRFSSPMFSTPSLMKRDSLLVVAEVSGNVHICSTATGEIIHTFTAGGNIFSGLLILDNSLSDCRIIFGCHDHHVYCVNWQKDKGLDLCWKTDMGSAVYSTPTKVQLKGDNPFVMAISTKGQLSLLEGINGIITAEHQIGAEVFSSCAVVDNNIYFGCRDNFLYSFEILQ